MMSPGSWRVLAPLLVCLCAGGCGSKTAPAKASDPNAPAVVRLPPPVLPSDTAKPDTMAAHVERVNALRTTLTSNYALLGAFVAFGDGRMLLSQYAPDAVLVTPDSTYTGAGAIAGALVALGKTRSVREFTRTPLDTRLVDSTVIDTGTYIMVSKRSGADSSVERGSYAATWRIHAPPLNWVLKKDALRPGGNRKTKR